MSFDTKEFLSEKHQRECERRTSFFEASWKEPRAYPQSPDKTLKEVDIVVLNEAYPNTKRTCWEMFTDRDDVYANPYGLPKDKDLLDVLVDFGFFPSRNIASKNGWRAEIPRGFSQFRIGKLKRLLTIYNPFLR